MVLHLRAMGVTCHNKITQCYMSPNTSEHTPPNPQPERLVHCKLSIYIILCRGVCPLKPMAHPHFHFSSLFSLFLPCLLLSSPFPLALSIPLPYSSLQIHLGGLGSAIRSPSGARGPKRILTHLRVSERTP